MFEEGMGNASDLMVNQIRFRHQNGMAKKKNDQNDSVLPTAIECTCAQIVGSGEFIAMNVTHSVLFTIFYGSFF